eukprot:3318161-Amphidinium_carterae.1
MGARRWRLAQPRSVVPLDSAQALCVQVASTRPDFAGMAAGLSIATCRQLKLDGQSQREDRKTAVNAVTGGMWHEERAHSAFQVGDTCVRCGEGVENLEHIVQHCFEIHHCSHWNKERRESGLPIHKLEAPACVRLHGLLPASPPGAVPTQEPALVMIILDAIAATLTSEDVGLVTSLTLANVPGSLCLAAGNQSLELNSWPLSGPWKNAIPGEWSVTAKELSKPCSSPRESIETSKCELGMPFLRLASST